MAGGAEEMRKWGAQTEALTGDVLAGVAAEMHRSITVGSAITGAPGQPVDTANLLRSWQIEKESETQYAVTTNVEYAEAVEDAIGPHGPRVYGAKNGIGGSHSVALTIAGAQSIVNVVTARVAAQQGFSNGLAGWTGEDGG